MTRIARRTLIAASAALAFTAALTGAAVAEPDARNAIGFMRIDASWTVGDTVDEAIAFQLALGPAGETYREAGDEAEARHEEIVARLGEALAPHQAQNGIVLASSSWRIDARNPA